ncbi:MAG: cytidine deaminase [Bacteroides sp.]|nr:cytidine deaminase [Bacteroides sp.]MCM1413920.1 cytidine deaminase [Bacteroides sp.]MCM1471653.1 cytidine deaminase [Bacteroides sp.]
MKQKEITTLIKVAKFDELDPTDRHLVELARDATFRSYAPYSHFRVGAAILLDNGEIITGANQENVAYPSGTCAERSACFYAHAQYPDAKFKTIAIAARDTDGNFVAEPVAPCGSCRQSLLEYEVLAQHPVKMILVGRDEIFILPSVASTLPLAFTEFN